MYKVLVLGGSFAGVCISHALLKQNSDVHVTLVNPHDDFYFCLAGPRIFADPSFFKPEQYLHSIKEAFKKYGRRFEFVKGLAEDIDLNDKTVLLSSSQRLSYDYLVIATGSKTTFDAFKPSGDLKESIKNLQDQIAKSKSIAIGGGGPLGIEIAGEIANSYPSKSLVLICATDRLLDTLKPSAGTKARNLLAKQNVKVIEGTKVKEYVDGKVYLTSNPMSKVVKKSKVTGYVSKEATFDNSGEPLDADLYIPATGVTPNNSAIPKSLLTSSGYVKVNKNMKVADYVYAAGDVTNISDKLASRAMDEAKVVASNISSEVRGTRPSKKFKEGPLMMLVPIGPSTGTGQISNIIISGFLIKYIKAKDFLISFGKSIAYQ